MSEDYRTVKARKVRNLELQRHGISVSLVPAGPIIDRLHTLHDLGWSFEAIAAWNRAGTAAALQRIRTGRSTNVERKFAPIATLPVTVAVPPHLPDSVYVPALGARRRVQSLLRLGWPHTDISAAAGVTSYSFSKTNGSYRRLRAGDWRRIDTAYEHLSGRPGPSRVTMLRAQSSGYLAPLAWDDIDDPNEHPTQAADVIRPDDVDEAVVQRILSGEWRLHSTHAERVQVVARWSGSHNDLERHTGWNIARYLRPDGAAA